ncbi:ABC transporter permease (plasmid) [Rhodococcus antarcticus]|uniref:ABC transporter permease n=1 Tax=Rhodococcus antarcticus TaxID=2987751 RepID=A0ABY6P5D5_9NOCA|nr:ABC transporter permease [Rhodococcus antarcticus]UZJ26862.1 ABC transporter permease [Rhodococcus antarcticus]
MTSPDTTDQETTMSDVITTPPETEPAGDGSRGGRGAGSARRVRSALAAREAGLAGVLLVLVVFLAWRSPYFITTSNITVVARLAALSLIIAVGMTFVILAAGIDLSVGSTVALTSIVTGETMVSLNLNIALAVALALLSGVAVGLVNGVIIATTSIPPFVVTLGMLAVARGLALGITQGQTLSGLPASFLVLGQGSIAGVPIPVWIAAGVAVVAHVALTRTRFGRNVYFVGSNEQAAVLSGIRVRRTKIIIFAIAGGLAGLEGIIETARLSVGQPSAGNGYELVAIGAVVIGGASLFGGEGSILGTVLGTVLLALIQDGLILLDISAYWQQVFSGVIIVAAVALNIWRQQRGRGK